MLCNSMTDVSNNQSKQVYTATRSCRDPETTVIHFWLPGGNSHSVSCLPVAAADATRYGRRSTAAAAAATAGRRRY